MEGLIGFIYFYNAIILCFCMTGVVKPNFVNPKVIYNYLKVNWFGVWLLAIICNILCPIVAIVYWFYKICTVGRK